MKCVVICNVCIVCCLQCVVCPCLLVKKVKNVNMFLSAGLVDMYKVCSLLCSVLLSVLCSVFSVVY